ncbi:sigma-70 family RNA polymerase sigma factor [Isobaculum melis]|uniref:RNA polymerase, sigma subunit, SigV n=1 Tax=Isobaculum melis TaxID=142588 RepID=A0A1H9RQE1_9LACT|nr:sigma-70 family RNA polymerase sigma factor [Isobaculum melis]SER75030.1 RNA polymerase, sigma subunit, SigV [Isobaculum melis]
METEKLVKKAKRGNRKALETLFNQIYVQLYKTALIYVGNEQDALDIVQETAFKITKKIHTLKDDKYFKTWAIRILIYTAYDLLDQTKKTENPFEIEEISSINPTKRTDENLDLLKALEQLPILQKNSIVLYYFQDLSIKEVADFMAIPEGTVKYYLHEARNKLKKILERTDKNG